MKGYKTLKDILSDTLKPACEKYGFITYRIINHWRQIVGKNIATLSHPIEISFLPNKNDEGLLTIGISNPGFALEIQASELIIINKLATYFGYKAISRIKIKITPKITNLYEHNTVSNIQEKSAVIYKCAKNTNNQILSIEEDKQINALIDKIADKEIAEEIAALKESLFTL